MARPAGYDKLLAAPSLVRSRAGAQRALILMVVVASPGCQNPIHDDILVPGLAEPSITVSLPGSTAKFPAGATIPLKVVVKSPAGQGAPRLLARIMKGTAIALEAVVGEPATVAGDEKTYQVRFERGVSRPGKYKGS